MTKEKLIKRYENQIKHHYDVLILVIKNKNRKLRNCMPNYTDTIEFAHLSSERRILQAQRQCTVQFISDLEDELD